MEFNFFCTWYYKGYSNWQSY